MVQLVGLGDCDPLFLSLDLAPVQFTGEVFDMCAGRVTPRLDEVFLYGKLLLFCDYVPCMELLVHCLDGLILVTHLVLFKLFHVLRVNGRNDGFDRHRICHLLKGVLLPFDPVVLLELEDLVPLGVVLNFWVKDIGIFDAPAVKFWSR